MLEPKPLDRSPLAPDNLHSPQAHGQGAAPRGLDAAPLGRCALDPCTPARKAARIRGADFAALCAVSPSMTSDRPSDRQSTPSYFSPMALLAQVSIGSETRLSVGGKRGLSQLCRRARPSAPAPLPCGRGRRGVARAVAAPFAPLRPALAALARAAALFPGRPSRARLPWRAGLLSVVRGAAAGPRRSPRAAS